MLQDRFDHIKRISIGKMKSEMKVDFCRKNLMIQFDLIFDFESNGGIFDSLVPFGGEL